MAPAFWRARHCWHKWREESSFYFVVWNVCCLCMLSNLAVCRCPKATPSQQQKAPTLSLLRSVCAAAGVAGQYYDVRPVHLEKKGAFDDVVRLVCEPLRAGASGHCDGDNAVGDDADDAAGDGGTSPYAADECEARALAHCMQQLWCVPHARARTRARGARILVTRATPADQVY